MKLLLLIISFLLALTGKAQFILKGLLVESGSQKPISGASVFLSNTSIGTVSNANGGFGLAIPAGKYDLVVSYVGFETVLKNIASKTDEVIKIEMSPKPQVLADVVVGGYEKDGWAKWGKFFTDYFIGTSEMADGCKIKNYKTIRFRNNKKEKKLTITASEPLIIENKSLGYVLSYQLESFEYDFKTSFLLFLGYPLFTQMEGSKSKLSKWQKNRDEAYYGSVMHFMRSLYRNRLKEEGFEVRRLVKTPNLEKARVKHNYRYSTVSQDSVPYYNRIMEQPDENSTFSNYTISGDSIAYALDSVTAGLQFGNYLHIYYPQKIATPRYRSFSPRNDKAMSEVKLINSNQLSVQSNGNYEPAQDLVTFGYWAWTEKISALLPFDYKPQAIIPVPIKVRKKK